MSAANDGSGGYRCGVGERITTIVYDGKGVSIPEGDPRGQRDCPKPKFEVDYDRSRHVVRITGPDGKTAEFDDRPERFLVMARNPKTRALEAVFVDGEPFYYYLARER